METIPKKVYIKSAFLCEKFPDIPFMTIAELLFIGMKLNDKPEPSSLPLGLDEDPEQVNPKIEHVPLVELRRSRQRRRQITFDNGKTFAYPSATDMLVMNGIDKNVQFTPHLYRKDEDYVALEAQNLYNLFLKHGKTLTEYVCYDFNGKRRVFMFPKESEAVNA